MIEKTGRNDPCPCGSGKKFKNCCMNKSSEKGKGHKIKAKWLNKPELPDLMEMRFGEAIDATGKIFVPPKTN